jgi:hypothetical protein
MTKRNPVSAPQNIWSDAQQVDNVDLTLEQNYNNIISSGIINNQVGSGVLPESLSQPILFDSSLATGFLDGEPNAPQVQPSDNNLGNQLEITLQNSLVSQRRRVKICIIGLDFQSNLQYEVFFFKENEIQVSKKHFTQILTILFNDFIGDPTLSLNLGGEIIIKEAKPLEISRDAIMVSQDSQPALFFRDFFVGAGYSSLTALLTAALPLYNVSSLSFNTQPLGTQFIYSGDVTTQVGQKFLASSNNIQKISVLLAVQNTGNPSDLIWNGDLIVSIYQLQSTIVSPSDIAPSLPIEFDPAPVPITQISFNYSSLQSTGTVLNGVFQPVDFVFSNSPIAGGNTIVPGNYYAFTVKRAGAANKCDILIATGGNTNVPNSWVTLFNGTLWVDLQEQDLWFQIWTDAAKVSDGQYYESGQGAIIPKTQLNESSGITVDYSLGQLSFVSNDIYHVIASTQSVDSNPQPDPRTGNPIQTQQEVVPNIELLNSIDTANLEQASEPLIIGAITDKNIKFYNSISSTITAGLHAATIVENQLIVRIVDDPTDTVRFDNTDSALISDLLNGYFVNAMITPDTGNLALSYRIASVELVSSILGDVNGDGIINQADLDLLETYAGFNMNIGLSPNSTVTTDGYHTTFVNGYNAQTVPFTNAFGISFQLVNTANNAVLYSGNDGVLVANPSNVRQAQFTSASVNFSNVIGISSYVLLINTPSVAANYGAFSITALDATSDVITLQKVFLSGDVLMEMLRADIDGDFVVSFEDGYLLQAYIDRQALTITQPSGFTGPTTNPYSKIGTRFNAIRFQLEAFVDRNDDYSTTVPGRSTAIHLLPDIFLADSNIWGRNFYTSPMTITILKELSWDESLITVNSIPRLVPTIFSSLSGLIVNPCTINGQVISKYEVPPVFDPGLVDVFSPNNVIIGTGELTRPNGAPYKVDFEVGTIILEIPDGLFIAEKSVNLMDDFIADYTGDGRTRLGYPSMRFADCSFVSNASLTNDQVRFSVSVQSFSPNTNGLSPSGWSGAIVDGKMGVALDPTTGVLTLNFTNLYQDAVLRTLNTKVQVQVYLKRGGFNNEPLFVNSTQLSNLLSLSSIFSGANNATVASLIDLTSDVSGILPIANGGTGLGTVGPDGYVLVSTGTGLAYQPPGASVPQRLMLVSNLVSQNNGSNSSPVSLNVLNPALDFPGANSFIFQGTFWTDKFNSPSNWARNTSYNVGNWVQNIGPGGGEILYVCTTSGVSSSSGSGPSVLGTGITDGTVVWRSANVSIELINDVGGTPIVIATFSTSYTLLAATSLGYPNLRFSIDVSSVFNTVSGYNLFLINLVGDTADTGGTKYTTMVCGGSWLLVS